MPVLWLCSHHVVKQATLFRTPVNEPRECSNHGRRLVALLGLQASFWGAHRAQGSSSPGVEFDCKQQLVWGVSCWLSSVLTSPAYSWKSLRIWETEELFWQFRKQIVTDKMEGFFMNTESAHVQGWQKLNNLSEGAQGRIIFRIVRLWKNVCDFCYDTYLF